MDDEARQPKTRPCRGLPVPWNLRKEASGEGRSVESLCKSAIRNQTEAFLKKIGRGLDSGPCL